MKLRAAERNRNVCRSRLFHEAARCSPCRVLHASSTLRCAARCFASAARHLLHPHAAVACCVLRAARWSSQRRLPCCAIGSAVYCMVAHSQSASSTVAVDCHDCSLTCVAITAPLLTALMYSASNSRVAHSSCTPIRRLIRFRHCFGRVTSAESHA
jgi:hypothetical protein